MPDDKNLGPWNNDNLDATAQQNVGTGIDAGTPKVNRFVSGVATLLKLRLETKQKDDSNQPAVFLLEPYMRVHDENAPKGCVPTLNKGLTSITGKLWFVNPALARGYYVSLEECDDTTLFAIVTDSLALGNVPVVIYDPRTITPDVRFYPRGLNEPDEYESINVLSANVTLERIFDVINSIYNNSLITPDAQVTAGSTWKRASLGYPHSEAEERIQNILVPVLQHVFLPCKVAFEQRDKVGRLDIAFIEPDPFVRGRMMYHAILELKVLRSFGDNGSPYTNPFTLNWIDSGVNQAIAYKASHQAVESALCCFDMRIADTGETCFDHVRKKADKNSIILKRWYLYSSSEAYRKVLVSK
jgi:hypothetical protein